MSELSSDPASEWHCGLPLNGGAEHRPQTENCRQYVINKSNLHFTHPQLTNTNHACSKVERNVMFQPKTDKFSANTLADRSMCVLLLWPRGYKKFMLNSAEHEIFHAHKY